MKKILLVVLVLGLSSISVAQLAKPALRGSEPYTPTKLEWLSVKLNANHRMQISGSTYFVHLDFLAKPANDEVTVVVSYSETADRVLINRLAEHGKELANGYAKNYGWSWVQVTEESRPSKDQPPGR